MRPTLRPQADDPFSSIEESTSVHMHLEQPRSFADLTTQPRGGLRAAERTQR